MFEWFVCLIRRHEWRVWYDKEFKRTHKVCQRCGMEKQSTFDIGMNLNYF